MILSKIAADKKIRRMALEIAEHNADKNEIIIIGIKENGIFIAQKIEQYLAQIFEGNIQTIALSINKKAPATIVLEKEINLQSKIILLVDDVANSGKTMLYALLPILQQNPASVQTLALVERTHKTFPLALNYVGLSVSTLAKEQIIVLVNNGEIEGAVIEN